MTCDVDRSTFATGLLDWWVHNKREFPWRSTRDPYRILVAEVLLHRTRARQVVPVYLEFVNRFPSIETLAHARLADVKTILFTLGLHWRIQPLLELAKEIMKKYQGKIPESKDSLMSLPGVSNYIASAVRCFAFDVCDSLLDTNIVRILGRVFNTRVTDSSRRSSQFQLLYRTIGSEKNPRDFAFAVIDLGALVCLPKEPLCGVCPVQKLCIYFLSEKSLAK